MDIKYLINICLILLILHIILINLNFNMKIGKNNNVERFTNNDSKSNDNVSNIDFLTSDKDSNDEFKKKLLKYIQFDENKENTSKESSFEKKNTSSILPSNTYTGDDNVPNFESNVADISKFYNINFDNMDEADLKNATPICNPPGPVKLKGNDASCEPKTGRESIELPTSWQYKNEMPMNGGSMNGIYGFDNLESQFASFNDNSSNGNAHANGTELNLQQSNDNNFKNIPHDDLRKPVVYN